MVALPAGTPRLLLDTNIVLALARGRDLGRWIRVHYPIEAAPVAPLVSVVTVGEMLSLARQFRWGEGRVRALHHLLAGFISLPLETLGVLDAYAMIDDHCQRTGRALNKNDLWIAATAHVTGAVLLTTDLDFDPLHPDHLTREWIDPTSRSAE
jgi:tRNA(fMet)-specific endonuclease VapC